jgi:hypothetical protein
VTGGVIYRKVFGDALCPGGVGRTEVPVHLGERTGPALYAKDHMRRLTDQAVSP